MGRRTYRERIQRREEKELGERALSKGKDIQRGFQGIKQVFRGSTYQEGTSRRGGE